jgi:hypothetical protein
MLLPGSSIVFGANFRKMENSFLRKLWKICFSTAISTKFAVFEATLTKLLTSEN